MTPEEKKSAMQEAYKEVLGCPFLEEIHWDPLVGITYSKEMCLAHNAAVGSLRVFLRNKLQE